MRLLVYRTATARPNLAARVVRYSDPRTGHRPPSRPFTGDHATPEKTAIGGEHVVGLQCVSADDQTMARKHVHRSAERRQCGSGGGLPDDLFDYAVERTPSNLIQPNQIAREGWTVTDDWPEDIPVTEAEVDAFEAWFGDLFDELFPSSR